MQTKYQEKHVRSIAKAITWRVLATLTTIVLVYIFTKNIVLSFSVGVLEVVVKMIVYYLHERAWSRISWGIKVKNINIGTK